MQVLQEGARLADRYSLIRRLGSGGMSDVWLAHDQRMAAEVALKVVATAEAGEAAARKRLKQEWQISSRLMHANILRVFEFHDEANGAFFAMQYVGELTLAAVTAREPAVALRPLGMIADALRYAHGKGVVHRDIKASNVLLDSRGSPCLADFGVAAPSGSDFGGKSGSKIASSPQQLEGTAAAPADDIFALGVLMHELLTGVPPQRAESAQINVTLPDGSLMPPALQSLLSDMLDYDPSARPDAETVALRLDAAGFPAGAVPARYLNRQVATDNTTIEAVDAVSPRRRAAAVAAESESAKTGPSKGVSHKVLYAGLGIAALLLVLVVYVLPSLVRDEPVNDQVAGDIIAPVEETVSENLPDEAVEVAPDPGDVAAIKALTDEALGDMLSQLERLRYRGIERWGGQAYLDAVDVYQQADEAYVNKNYQLAGDRYRQASKMLEPFFDQIEDVFDETLAEASVAFERGDPSEAVRLYDLATAITPGNRTAETGLARALNLESVLALALTSQGQQFETELALEAARTAYEKALELDSAWEPAVAGLERVRVALQQMSFQQRMTEGFEALAASDYPSARAAFEAARKLEPDSRQPTDGLMQVEQEIKLNNIRRLEQQAAGLVSQEQWESSIAVYESLLEIDSDLQFAKEGLATSRQRSSLHARLQSLIDQPDNLGDPANIRSATTLLLDATRATPQGPRLAEQRNELSRLLKRAATPMQVQLRSDNATSVSILKVGNLGQFSQHELELRPGKYVATGIRSGYRDVRIEFRVAPEINMQPIVVQCEEPI